MESSQMELKVYKLMSGIRGSMLAQLINRARNKAEYPHTLEEADELFKQIANPAKWDYIGLLSEKDKAVLEVLEYLVDDSATEVYRRKAWEPPVR